MTTAKQIFGIMQGVWGVSRKIIHKMPVETYEGNGYAAFSLLKGSENTLLYHERVKLQNSQTHTEILGHQKYRYKYDVEADRLLKFFDDGGNFYKVSIEGEEAYGGHLCIRDSYKAKYHFNAGGTFSLSYEIKGPAKDYAIFTEYTRIEPGDLPALGIVVNDGEIAILGAGPSGLVAAKHALGSDLSPIVLEKSSEIGGVWNPKTGAVWKSMTTNLSKYTCSFEGMAWPYDAPVFPSSTEMFGYLNHWLISAQRV